MFQMAKIVVGVGFVVVGRTTGTGMRGGKEKKCNPVKRGMREVVERRSKEVGGREEEKEGEEKLGKN
jgi:hypothetical protein